jgi:hypothetical protein
MLLLSQDEVQQGLSVEPSFSCHDFSLNLPGSSSVTPQFFLGVRSKSNLENPLQNRSK